MNILIRVDASTSIGGGHVSRCLNLASALKDKVKIVEFLCYKYEGNSIKKIKDYGFKVNVLPEKKELKLSKINNAFDYNHTINFLMHNKVSYNLLVVDNYFLDIEWEKKVKPFVNKIMVIDDLGNREHDCDFLLDQVYGSSKKKYYGLLPQRCKCLFGSKYILLDSKFGALNKKKILSNKIKNKLHVFFGTNDQYENTIRFSKLALENFSQLILKIAISGNFNYLKKLHRLKSRFKERISWDIEVKNMAEHMADCSLALGSPGMSTWERACMGLPSLHIINSPSQTKIMEKLKKSDICDYLGNDKNISDKLFIFGLKKFLINKNSLSRMKKMGLINIDGKGVFRVVDFILKEMKNE